MFYDNYNFFGMHLGWWFIWAIMLFWIFATPYDIPGQRPRRNSALEVLKRRFANGQINKEEYLESKEMIESKA
jgi:putative membrane protein